MMTEREEKRNGSVYRSIEELAEGKRLSEDWLRSECDLRDLERGCIGIPYRDMDGSELFVRVRLPVTSGKRFDQPRGVPLEPYGLWRLEQAAKGGYLYVTEGESDTWALWHSGLPALGLPGVDAVGALDPEHLHGIDKLYLLADNDQAGRRMAERLAVRLAAIHWDGRLYRVPVPEEHKDVSDWRAANPAAFLSALSDSVEIAEIVPLSAGKGKGQANKGQRQASGGAIGLAMTCLATIRPQPIRWLVPGYIPRGKNLLIAGDGGHGKSSLTLHMAACITQGWPCLGLSYEPGEPGEVLLISCEDDYADTVVPRLLSAGADLSRVHRVDGIKTEEGRPAPFSMAHYEALDAELARRPDIRLVVIDPAGAYIGRAGVDEHKDAVLRSVLDPLAEVAARQAVTVLLVKHLVKGATAKAVHKVSGSAGYVNAVRAAYLVAPSTDDPDLKLFLPMKLNLGLRPRGLSYRLQGLSEEEAAGVLAYCPDLGDEDREQLRKQLFRLDWQGEVDANADELMAQTSRQERGPGRVDECKEWLLRFLAEYAYPSEEIWTAAAAEGFTFDTMKTAKAKLKEEGRLQNRKMGNGPWWSGLGHPKTWKRRLDPNSYPSSTSSHPCHSSPSWSEPGAPQEGQEVEEWQEVEEGEPPADTPFLQPTGGGESGEEQEGEL